MGMLNDSALKRMKKDDLVKYIRLMERRNNAYVDFISEHRRSIEEKALRQIKKDVESWRNITEVVRCKDCKHYKKDSLSCGMNSKDRGEWFNWYEDDFCSYGERKDNG